MDKITTLNTLKNVFSALGAKTTDDNYAVGLFDKTSAEPKGLMGMSDLASVLGGRVTDAHHQNYVSSGVYKVLGIAVDSVYNDDGILIVAGDNRVKIGTNTHKIATKRGNVNWVEW